MPVDELNDVGDDV